MGNNNSSENLKKKNQGNSNPFQRIQQSINQVQQDYYQTKSVNFQKRNYEILPENQIAKKICEFDRNLVLNYSLEFLDFIKTNQEKNIKIITFIGPTGAGKSTIQNMIIKQFQSQQSLKMVFKTAATSEQGTIGVDYYAFQDKTGVVYVFFDCQGFQGISLDENAEEDRFGEIDEQRQKVKQDIEREIQYEVKLSQLLSLICGLSTCVFYVTKEELRTEKPLKILLQQIDIEKQNKYFDNLKNFVKIINQSKYEFMGQPPPALLPPQQRNKFEQVFQEQFFLTSFRTNKETDVLYLTDGYKETITQITNYIQKSQFINKQSWMKSFQSQQTCLNFYDIIENAFEIINQGFEQSAKNFLEIINLQLDLKKKFREKITQNKVDSEIQRKQIFEILDMNAKSGHVSSSLCLLLQDFIAQKGYRLIREHFNSTCEWWKQELHKKIESLLQLGSLKPDQREYLLSRYTQLKSIEPRQYRLKEQIIGTIKEQEKANIVSRAKFALVTTASGAAGFVVGVGVVSEVAVITSTLLIGAIALPLTMLTGGIYLVNNVIQQNNRTKKYKQLRRNLRDSLCNEVIKNCGQIPISSLKRILKENFGSKFESEVNNLSDNEKECYIFHLYFNLLKSKLEQKHLEISQRKENLELFENTLNKYKLQYQNAKIDFKVIFHDKKINVNQNSYEFENNQFRLIDVNLKNRIDMIGYDQFKELISSLLTLRHVDSYFIIETIRQTHFESILSNTRFQEIMVDQNGLEKFFKFQNQVIEDRFSFMKLTV